MADLAAVFHWQPDQMYKMALPDLLDWHDKARERIEVSR